MKVQLEIERLDASTPVANRASNAATVRFVASGAVSAFDAVELAKVVMRTCVPLSSSELDDLELLRAKLPSAFVAAFDPEPTPLEAQKYLDEWRAASDSARVAMEKSKRWSLLSWSHWMKPQNRTWWWWGAMVIREDCAVISVVVDEWPFAIDALRVLLVSCGFEDVRPDRI